MRGPSGHDLTLFHASSLLLVPRAVVAARHNVRKFKHVRGDPWRFHDFFSTDAARKKNAKSYFQRRFIGESAKNDPILTVKNSTFPMVSANNANLFSVFVSLFDFFASSSAF